MHKGIPTSVKPLLDDYILAMNQALPDYMAGFYIHGSIALGDFQPQFSDIDCITVISRQSTHQDVERLQDIHERLKQKYPQCLFSGSYLRWQDLGKFESSIAPYPYYQDGHFHPQGYHDINFVTWWLLAKRGLALVGPDPQTLNIELDWGQFDMIENLNIYWIRFTKDLSRMRWLLSDYGIQWAILGILRLFYSLREQDITSKTEAGKYGLKQLPSRWHRIISEAIRLRLQQPSMYRFRLVRAVEALNFLQYIIHLCNTQFAIKCA